MATYLDETNSLRWPESNSAMLLSTITFAL